MLSNKQDKDGYTQGKRGIRVLMPLRKEFLPPTLTYLDRMVYGKVRAVGR